MQSLVPGKKQLLAVREVSLLRRTKPLCPPASWTGACSVPCLQRAARSLDCVNKEPSQLIKEVIVPHCTTSRYCSPSPGRTLINQQEFSKRPPTHPRMKHLTWGNTAGSACKQRQLWEGQTAATAPPMKRPSKRGNQAGLSSTQWGDQTQKLKGEIPTGCKKQLFQCETGLSNLLLISKLILFTAQTGELLSSLPAPVAP